MKLQKAIEILQLNVNDRSPQMPPDVIDALKLLIEAGRCIRHNRLIGQHFDPELLPGEEPE